YSDICKSPPPVPLKVAFRAIATDNCGNQTTTDLPAQQFFCVIGPGQPSKSATLLSSDLRLPGGVGHLLLNGRGMQSVVGLTRIRVSSATIENLVEGVVAGGKGQEGTWRFEISGDSAVGVLSVETGNVVQVAGHVVVFRLSGTPGERVAFRFATKP